VAVPDGAVPLAFVIERFASVNDVVALSPVAASVAVTE
jgi:hypothetical protein